MEFSAATSCNGTSPEFLLALGLGSTGMLCFTAIALGYLQYLGKSTDQLQPIRRTWRRRDGRPKRH
ncbi:hypothetical protein RvY_06002 [Ramazzottius varieornatus]|uniref:Uncharacterized protein n=1 Tax=Ramazzottius varieornatus TaxID=947166 RepID=A0A1D1V3I8_RAMVA|nr:hypothetical protein RvY_06002 [Ramazzottius varieornatus]